MGSSLSQQLCCVPCQRCREQEAAHAEPGETKPILQSPGDTRMFFDTQPPTPALKVPKHASKDLSQHQQPSANALEENGEPCSAAEGWEAAWNPMDFFVAHDDEEVEGEVEDLTQEETEEEMKPVPDVPVAEEEQPGTEGAPCAGITLQEGKILSLMELSSEAEPGQGWRTEPPAGTTGALVGREMLLSAVQVAGQAEPCLGAEPLQGTDRAKAAETSPRSTRRAELTCLVEVMPLLTLQSPLEVIARGLLELYSTSAESWEPLCPQWGSLEPPSRLLELFQQGTRGSLVPAQGSLCCAGLAGLTEISQQPRDGGLCELGQEGSRGCTPGPEAEPQRGVTQPALELPEEPAASVPVPVKQEAEPKHVPLSLPEVLGSSGEREAENVEV